MGPRSTSSPIRLSRLLGLGLSFLTLTSITHVHAQTDAGQAPPKRYACPGDNGARYTTGGITFELKCGQGTTANRIDDTVKKSLNSCADYCAEHPDCQSADWNPVTKNCARFSEYIPTIPMANVNTWFPIEERSSAPIPIEFDDPQCPKTPELIVERYGHADYTTMGMLCPQYDEKIYISKDGTYFQVKCYHQSSTLDPMFDLPAGHLGECLSICANTEGCKSATFLPQTYKCRLYSTGGDAVVSADGSTIFNSGYVIDPPSYEVEDTITEKCTKTCPHAHGETFDEDGQTFRISCCRRHGVKTFGSESDVPSLAACTKLCSRLTACISADYHEQSRTCYFGKHFGEPAVSAPGWASVYSLGCSGMCREKKVGGACCGGAAGSQGSSTGEKEL